MLWFSVYKSSGEVMDKNRATIKKQDRGLGREMF